MRSVQRPEQDDIVLVGDLMLNREPVFAEARLQEGDVLTQPIAPAVAQTGSVLSTKSSVVSDSMASRLPSSNTSVQNLCTSALLSSMVMDASDHAQCDCGRHRGQRFVASTTDHMPLVVVTTVFVKPKASSSASYSSPLRSTSLFASSR